MAQPAQNFVTINLTKANWDGIIAVLEPEFQRRGPDWLAWGNYVKGTIQAETSKAASPGDPVSVALPVESWRTIVSIIDASCAQQGGGWKTWGDGITQTIQQAIGPVPGVGAPAQPAASGYWPGQMPGMVAGTKVVMTIKSISFLLGASSIEFLLDGITRAYMQFGETQEIAVQAGNHSARLLLHGLVDRNSKELTFLLQEGQAVYLEGKYDRAWGNMKLDFAYR